MDNDNMQEDPKGRNEGEGSQKDQVTDEEVYSQQEEEDTEDDKGNGSLIVS